MNRNSLALFASFAFMVVLFCLSISPQPISSSASFAVFIDRNRN